jgi:SPP1 family predicted phage head-tail adaptor
MAPDGAGGYSRSWQNVAELWAEVEPLTGADARISSLGGKEILQGGQLQSEVTHRVLIRYRAGVSAAQRLLFDNRAFNIRFVVNNGERQDTLMLLVQEGVAG